MADSATPRLKRDWVGLTVRTRRELNNGLAVVPAGTVLDVTGYSRGLRLLGRPCECCGVQVRVTKVPEDAVTIVDPEVVAHGR